MIIFFILLSADTTSDLSADKSSVVLADAREDSSADATNVFSAGTLPPSWMQIWHPRIAIWSQFGHVDRYIDILQFLQEPHHLGKVEAAVVLPNLCSKVPKRFKGAH